MERFSRAVTRSRSDRTIGCALLGRRLADAPATRALLIRRFRYRSAPASVSDRQIITIKILPSPTHLHGYPIECKQPGLQCVDQFSWRALLDRLRNQPRIAKLAPDGGLTMRSCGCGNSSR